MRVCTKGEHKAKTQDKKHLHHRYFSFSFPFLFFFLFDIFEFFISPANSEGQNDWLEFSIFSNGFFFCFFVFFLSEALIVILSNVQNGFSKEVFSTLFFFFTQ